MATTGLRKTGLSACRKENIPKIAPAKPDDWSLQRPTDDRRYVHYGGVAYERYRYRYMKPRRVNPRNSAMPPIMPATTICLVSKRNMEPFPSLPEPIAMTFSF